jgi:hypothetical protein
MKGKIPPNTREIVQLFPIVPMMMSMEPMEILEPY